jgi:hypothetical protein
MPVTMDDLLGAKVDAEVVSARMGRLENQQCLILIVTINGATYRYGVLPEIISKVLASGRKNEEGKVILKLPAPNTNARITWVNAY